MFEVDPHTARRSLWVLALAPVFLLPACSDADDDSGDSVRMTLGDEAVHTLLAPASATVLDQPIGYPDGRPQVSMSVVTLQPGEETGFHHHDAPLAAWVLQGTLTVDYGESGERTYQEGEAFLEAVETTHNGRSSGEEPVRILVVNMGAEGIASSVADE